MSSPCEGKPEGHVTSSRENNDRETAGFEPGDPPLLAGAHSRYLMPGRGNTRGGRLEEESARRGVGRRDRKAFEAILRPRVSGNIGLVSVPVGWWRKRFSATPAVFRPFSQMMYNAKEKHPRRG